MLAWVRHVGKEHMHTLPVLALSSATSAAISLRIVAAVSLPSMRVAEAQTVTELRAERLVERMMRATGAEGLENMPWQTLIDFCCAEGAAKLLAISLSELVIRSK
jgi:hypothetical protein